MIELTDKQQRELAGAGWPPRVVNPSTRETFVLLHAEIYERVRAILEAEDELDAVREMQPLVNEALDRVALATVADEDHRPLTPSPPC